MKHDLFDMFLFLFKSKYRRKRIAPIMTTKVATNFAPLLLLVIVFGLASLTQCSLDRCKDVECGNGICLNGTCVCNDGWQGPQCQYCGGKVKLNGTSGFISDGIGNYSLDVKCSWLIEAGNSTNSTIRLHFEEFITECGWDHLYIYDGDSVHSPLLGVYSGLMYSKDYSLQSVPEIVAHSGFALLHFYSDIAYNLSGFNISYSLNTCPSTTSSKECSGHGVCVDSVCTCDAQFIGEACHIPICPNKCTASNGVCDKEQHRCVCNPKYKGDDCSQVAEHGYWELLKTSDFVPQGSASHTAVVWQDSMYIVGGESFKKGHMLYVYDFNGHVWETPHVISKTAPTIRYGHSSVLFGDKIYVYGGVKEDGIVCNELWAYDISAKSWENVTVNTGSCERNLMNIGFTNQALCGPLRSAGHTATLVPPSFISQSTSSGSGSRYVTERMIIIFGHSPTYGFMNFVQEYYFGTREWAVVKTKGYPVKGGYGHSAAWDPVTERILVYGGYVSMSPLQSALSSKLYAYDPYSHTWYLMSDGPSGRFLHSGSMLSPTGGLMLIYGGNIHNDTGVNLVSSGGQCYTAQPLLYDTYCDSWTQMALPSNLFTSLMRFGHSAITFEKSMYLYGGFNGQMLNDILKFSPGNCSSNNMITNCLNSRHFGVKCVWDNEKAICLPFSEIPVIPPSIDFESTYSRCPEESKSQVTGIIDQCKRQTTCESCVHTHRCGWCPLSNSCVHDIEQCTTMNRDDIPYRSERPITSGYQCTDENADHMRCNHLHSCQYCVTHTGCHWNSKIEVPICVPITNKSMIQDFTSPDVCESVCDHYTECTNCTKDECIWCQNNERCIDKNAYTSSFPYGQCREWTTDEHRCRTSPGNSQCNYYRTCIDCRDDPECGWCDDGSGTGLGSCMAGGNTPPQSCSQNKWYFTHCPTCQCNGHSTCMNNTDVCIHPCSNNTEGQNCETCIKGFYGNPVNGGECKECRCNNQGNHCNQENGKCYCTTKGIIGDNCEKCDTNNHYLGDPSNHGSCFYDLTIDYQFTFNLSKKDDLRFTQINFQNSPSKSDVDADFSITCSVMAKMNITVRPASGPEKMLLPLQNCTNFRTKFLKSEYMFGTGDNMSLTTFYVYVYDFKPPLWIQISFSQYPKLNLQQFFITFSSCFLLLLLVAAILWKLKQKYDMYRRRQRMFVEMEQMASRPFSVVEVEIEKRNAIHGNQIPSIPTISVSSNLRKRKIDVPNPVALEPCAGNRAAVLTLLVRQPTGNDRFTPHGYSGLAIASALVVVGNVQHSKNNGIDNNSSPLPGKEDVRWTGRGLKASQHPSEARI